MPLHLISEADKNALITHCMRCGEALADHRINHNNNATWSEATYDASPMACDKETPRRLVPRDVSSVGAAMREPIEAVNHPNHYGGDTVYETIKVLKAWGLETDALLWNAVKYISRAGKKGDLVEDLKKARFYLDRKIADVEAYRNSIVLDKRSIK